MIAKDNTYKVMKLFFDSPEKKFHIREIARLVRLSAPGVINIIGKLKKEGLVISRKEKVVVNVQVAKTEDFRLLKRCYNIQNLNRSGIISFLRDRYEEPEAIVLFGSYSKGEDISTSDIDIAIVTQKALTLDIKKFEKKLKKKINIYEAHIKTAEKEFMNELANGTVLHGYLMMVK